MSSDLVWQIIRNNSSTMKTRRNVSKKFSTERFNVMGVNSQKFNGFTNNKAIDIQLSADRKALVVSTKIAGKDNLPAQAVKTVVIKKNNRAALKSVRNLATNYKSIYVMPAQRRASALLRSLKAKKSTAKSA